MIRINVSADAVSMVIAEAVTDDLRDRVDVGPTA
jgi:hypothetical protein